MHFGNFILYHNLVMLTELKHSFRSCVFSFLPIFWVSCQIRQKFHFLLKFSNFCPYLAWNVKNWQKITEKNEKMQHAKESFWVNQTHQKQFLKFWFFFLAGLKRKMAKKLFFCDFLKFFIFGVIVIFMKFPFEKCIHL